MNDVKVTHYRWEDIPKEELKPDLHRRLVTGERTMLAHVFLDKGCIVPQHSHDNEQLTYILQGTLRFFLGEVGSEVVDVHAGEVLHLSPGSRTRPRRSRTRSTSTSSAPAPGLARRLRRLPPRRVGLGWRARSRSSAARAAASGARSPPSSLPKTRRWRTACGTPGARAAAAELDPDVLAVLADLSVAGEPTCVVEATLERFGRLDVPVANPAGRRPALTTRLPSRTGTRRPRSSSGAR